MSTVYENTHNVSHAVSDFLRESKRGGHPLTLRPFNRFDTANTEWWLIPSSEYPAYKFSKLCFHRYPRNAEGALYTGFYVEKGLAPELANLPEVQKTHIMTSQWFWHTFLKQANEGIIDPVIEQVCQNTKSELRILIEANEFNKVPQPDTERSTPNDTVEFSVFPATQQWKLVQESQGVLSKLCSSANLSALAQNLASTDDLRFYWIDLTICIRLGFADNQGWHSSDIWDKALQPWVVLLK